MRAPQLPPLLLLTTARAFFLPAVPSSAVTSKVRTVRIDDIDIAVARRNGTCVAWVDACPHRGMSFADATVSKGGHVECGYHGFRFAIGGDGGGALTSGLGCASGCASLTMLPVRDVDGLVWIAPDGDEAIEPVTMPPENFQTGFRTITGTARVRCTSEQFLENVVDCTHLASVHTFGNREDPVPHNYTAVRTSPFTGEATFRYRTSKTSAYAFLSPNSTFLHVLNEYRLPATVSTTVTSPNGDIKVVRAHARQDGDETVIFWSLTRNFVTHPWLDCLARFIFLWTLSEDAVVLRRCDAEYQKGTFHSRFDKLQVLRRHALRALSKK
jgi:phenylpropionate dioxygenase-like ring-hydroxylating dioxygenase large terminal subunit